MAGKQVFFHDDPQVSIINGEAYFNFDFMITDGTILINGQAAERIVPEHMVFMNRRYSKTEQAMRINSYAKRMAGLGHFNAEEFIGVRTWLNSQPLGMSNLVQPTGKVVIKPKDGARGIGQFLIDTDKIPFAVVITALDKFVIDGVKEDLFKELKRYDPNLAYSTKGEKSDDEGLTGLRLQGFVVQSLIENIEAEYRLITDEHGRVAYCQKRTITSVEGFPQASGSDTNSILGEDIVPIDNVLSPGQFRDISAVARDVIGPLSSIDLFVTKDKKWGIFEYCNQFGIKGVPGKTVMAMHENFIADVIDRLFGTERIATPGQVKSMIATVS
ncbi:hypothetical protein D9M70_465150 [compost metagenome]